MRNPTFAALAISMALILLGASPVGVDRAEAGNYVIRNCNVPGHAPASVGPWKHTLAPNTAWVDTCSAGGGFGFALPAVRSMGSLTRASLNFARSSDAQNAIEFRRLRLWVTTRLIGTGARLFVPTTVTMASGENRLVRILVPPGSDASASPIDTILTDGTSMLQIALECGSTQDARASLRVSTLPDCYPNDPMPLEVRGTEITLQEDVPPSGSSNGGTMLANGSLAGARTLDYVASDGESGLTRVEALIGDVIVAARDLSSTCAYADFRACPGQTTGSLSIDTRQIEDGRHLLSLRVSDAAGNRQVVQVRPVDIRNRASVPPDPSSSATVTVGFAGSSRSTLIIPYERRATLRGRFSASRPNLGNARIDVLERRAGKGAREVAVGTTRTRADGTFSYALARRKPSRTVRVVCRASCGAGAPAVSGLLKLRVRAASTLRVSLSGKRVRFSGRVLARPIPAGGKRVMLQGRASGFKWATFADARTDRRGRFSGSYRLPIRRPGVKLQIRVSVPTQRAYSYLSYRSRSVSVRVR